MQPPLVDSPLAPTRIDVYYYVRLRTYMGESNLQRDGAFVYLVSERAKAGAARAAEIDGERAARDALSANRTAAAGRVKRKIAGNESPS